MSFDITAMRLHNQHLVQQHFTDPADLVRHMGAVQGQEYLYARWAVGMRVIGATERSVEQALTDGTILRTHVLRPTWHFLARDDIRWILSLSAPRVHAVNAFYYRQAELDDALFARIHALFEEALGGANYLTRVELASILEREGIAAGGPRLSYIMMHAELDGLLCSGPRRGNQFTYALISERAPDAKLLPYEEALVELTKRYFTSHGPATVHDFAWWSGLTIAQIKAGLEMARPDLESMPVGNATYWFAPQSVADAQQVDISSTVYLLAPYDEYGIAYKDRKELTEDAYLAPEAAGKMPALPYPMQIAIGGKIVGGCKRTLKKDSVLLEAYFYRPLTDREQHDLEAEVDRYGAFIGLAATLESSVL